MEIRINNEPLEIQVQNEKNALDLVQGISAWLNGQGYTLLELKINNQVIDLAEKSWQKIAIESIETLEIQAPQNFELRQMNIQILADYALHTLETLEACLQDQDKLPILRNYLETFADIIPSANYLESSNSSSESLNQTLIKHMDEEVENLLSKNFILKDLEDSKLKLRFQHLAILCQDRLGELIDPLKTAQNTAEALKKNLEDLSLASTRIMTGESKLAFDSILQFSELLAKLLRVFQILLEKDPGQAPIDQSHLEDQIKKSNSVLQEVGSALERDDSILLGDLLEYELPEYIEGLIALIPA